MSQDSRELPVPHPRYHPAPYVATIFASITDWFWLFLNLTEYALLWLASLAGHYACDIYAYLWVWFVHSHYYRVFPLWPYHKLLMNIWVVSSLLLLWGVLLWSLVHVSLVNMDTHLNVTVYLHVDGIGKD